MMGENGGTSSLLIMMDNRGAFVLNNRMKLRILREKFVIFTE